MLNVKAIGHHILALIIAAITTYLIFFAYFWIFSAFLENKYSAFYECLDYIKELGQKGEVVGINCPAGPSYSLIWPWRIAPYILISLVMGILFFTTRKKTYTLLPLIFLYMSILSIAGFARLFFY